MKLERIIWAHFVSYFYAKYFTVQLFLLVSWKFLGNFQHTFDILKINCNSKIALEI
jgi:hypothetical protein